MPASYSDGSDGANNWTSGGEDDSTGIVDLPPLPAPNARSPNQKDDGSGSQLAYMVDLDKLLKGPIEEIYRNNAPGVCTTTRLNSAALHLGVASYIVPCSQLPQLNRSRSVLSPRVGSLIGHHDIMGASHLLAACFV
jgi:hypothetical protein